MDATERRAAQRMDIGERLAKVRTKRELAELFRDLGIRAQKRLGQHFLVDHNLLDFMVRAAEVGPDTLVVDIGCGTGLLTAHLADAAGHVVGVEKDRRLFAICCRYLEGRENATLLHGDALESKHRLSPRLLGAVLELWASGRFAALKVVSNLPYAIASLVVPNLLESDLPITAMLVTVQREVAERMQAAPHSRDYGALSVVVQAQAAVALVRAVPPDVFWPRPQVESAIVRLVPQPERAAAIADYERFLEVVRGAFLHRRKSLPNALATSHVLDDKAAIGVLLERRGIEPSLRADHVSVDQYIALANALSKSPA